jgi:hypothetical protein
MGASETPTIISSEKTVTAAGTAEALSASSQRVRSLSVIAKTGNTGQVYVGGSDVASSTNDGLAPGDTLMVPSLNWLDLSAMYVDVDVSGEGVDFYAVKA